MTDRGGKHPPPHPAGPAAPSCAIVAAAMMPPARPLQAHPDPVSLPEGPR